MGTRVAGGSEDRGPVGGESTVFRPVQTRVQGCLLALLTLAAAAPAGPVEIQEVEIGFEQAYRPGHITPVRVRLSNLAGDVFQGQLQIVQRDDDGDQVIWHAPADLPPNAAEDRMVLFIPNASALEQVGRVQLSVVDARGRAVVTRDLGAVVGRPPRPLDHARVVGIVGSAPGGFTHLARPSTLNEEAEIIAVPPGRMPVLWQALDAFDVIYWDDPNPQDLSIDQQAALIEWTQRGGHLAMGLGGHARELDVGGGSQFSRVGLLPVSVERTGQTSQMFGERLSEVLLGSDAAASRLPATAPVVAVRARGGAVVMAYDSGLQSPLLTRWAYGAGTVTVLSATLADSLLQSSVRPAATVAPGGTPPGGAAPAAYGMRPDDIGRSLATLLGMRAAPQNPALQAVLTNGLGAHLDASEVGGVLVAIVVLLSLVYAAIAGPGTWLYLRYVGRPHLSWWVFGLVVAIAIGASLLLTLFNVRGPSLTQVTVLDLTPGNAYGVVEGYVGLYEPAHRDVTVSIADEGGRLDTVVPMIEPGEPGQGGYPDVRRYEIDALDLSQVPEVPIRRTIKRFEIQWKGDVGGHLDGGIQVVAGEQPGDVGFTGQVDNHLPVDLSDVRLFLAYEVLDQATGAYGTRYAVYPLGSVRAGQRATFDSRADERRRWDTLMAHHRSLAARLGLEYGIGGGRHDFGELVEMLTTLQLYPQPAPGASYNERRAVRSVFGRLDRSAMIQPPRGNLQGSAILIGRAEGFFPAQVRWGGHDEVRVSGPAIVRCVLPVTQTGQ